MGIEALTHSDNGTVRSPKSASDWDRWVSPTRARNYILDDPLLDWLDLHGEARASSAIRRLRNTIHARTSPSSSSSKVTSSKRLSSSCLDETIASKRLRPCRAFMPVA